MERRKAMMLGGIGGAIGAVLVLGGVLNFGGGDGLPEIGAANAEEAAQIDTSGVVEMVMGQPDAPVTVIEYASFTCPHCATFHLGPSQRLKAEYVETGKVQLIYRDVYFDRPGLWAALVARCEPTRFFGMTEMLYRQQRDWIGSGDPAEIAANLRRLGIAAGLEPEQVDACLSDADSAQMHYAWFQANAAADEINSTPSLVINGQKYSNMSWADLSSLIDGKLPQ